jgi:hypothetical protein
MAPETIEPWELDLAQDQVDPDEACNGLADPPYCMIYNFAIAPENDSCVLVEIDMEGRVQRAARTTAGHPFIVDLRLRQHFSPARI